MRNAVSDFGISGPGVAAAMAVPLVAIGGLALLSPLALGRKKRDVDGLTEGKTLSFVVSPSLPTGAKCFVFASFLRRDQKPRRRREAAFSRHRNLLWCR